MNLKDLETIGYVYIPNFLSATEIKLLVSEYKHSKIVENKNYALVHSEIAKKILGKKVKALMDQVTAETCLTIDHITPTVNYTDTKNLFFDWHQDHESYYVYQQSKNHLNFYIPVIKPDPELSGMSLVPMDKVCEYLVGPQIERIVDYGATRFVPHSTYTHVIDEETGKDFNIPININTISVTPQLNAGDLLLLRGDVIHKTQDNSTHRVAISIRAIDGNALVSKEKLQTGCEKKKKYITSNQPYYDSIFELFETAKTDIIMSSDIDKGSNHWTF
jgi:ectoine hydroxylase-related dioxygenase (phytanoyl-CoA dioxygenase family)